MVSAEALVNPDSSAMSILVIDDARAFAQAVCRYVERQGFTALAACTAREGLDLAAERSFDVALVDIRLPDMDGVEVCRRLRKMGDMILVVSSIYEKAPMIEVTEEVADIWITKPVRPAELVARIRALHRRSQASSGRTWVYNDGYLFVDLIRRLVKCDGQRVELSTKEFDLLSCLLERRNQVTPRDDLLECLWEPDQAHREQYLTQYISRLRQKIERRPEAPSYIRTVRGQGYWFCSQGVTEPIVGNRG